MATWQIQEAKARFSEVIENAQTDGPQTITRHGKARAVVLSAREYEALARKAEPDFKHFLLREGPKFEDFEIAREQDFGRDVDLD